MDAVGTGVSDNKPKSYWHTILASGDVKADGTVEGLLLISIDKNWWGNEELLSSYGSG